MGKRGPKPLPTALKKARGTYRRDRTAANEIQPIPGIPAPPAWLDAEARDEWDPVVPQLAEQGVLTSVDGAALEGYCSNYAAAVRLQRIADAAPIVEGLHGPKENPAASAARKHWALVRQFAAEFGLTPSARSRVGAPDAKPKQEGEEAQMFGAFLP